MSIYVYNGPTLSTNHLPMMPGVVYLPPVKHGDIIDALSKNATCIAIIDGYYETIAACRHKEILQALEQGVRVMGSSSMGALRAAELDSFGMEGFGQIYKMYASGEIDGDDEVGVRHTPASEGFRSLSLPLVELRYTLKKIIEQELITEEVGGIILESAKSMYFGDRTLKNIFNKLSKEGFQFKDLDLWGNIIKTNWISLKALDAEEMLMTLYKRVKGEEKWPVLHKVFTFNYTNFLHRWISDQKKSSLDQKVLFEREVVSQIKFETEEYPTVRQKANELSWVAAYADDLGIIISEKELDIKIQEFFADVGFSSLNEQKDWLCENMLKPEELKDYLSLECKKEKVMKKFGYELNSVSQVLLSYLKDLKISVDASQIQTEWRRFWYEIELLEDSTIIPDVHFSLKPKYFRQVPKLDFWCKKNNLDLGYVKDIIGKKVLLRKLASYFYIAPGIVQTEHIIPFLKITGNFLKSFKNLATIIDFVEQKVVNPNWNPHWKNYLEQDQKIIKEYCHQRFQVDSNNFWHYIYWKGFGDYRELSKTAALNRLAESNL